MMVKMAPLFLTHLARHNGLSISLMLHCMLLLSFIDMSVSDKDLVLFSPLSDIIAMSKLIIVTVAFDSELDVTLVSFISPQAQTSSFLYGHHNID